jgi:Sec-independent protein translocase protein TatA
MFGIGFWECMIIFLVALVVVDPKDLPVMAHRLGRCISHARRSVRRFWQHSQSDVVEPKDKV